MCIISRNLQKSKVKNDTVNYNKCSFNVSQEITKEHKLAQVHKRRSQQSKHCKTAAVSIVCCCKSKIYSVGSHCCNTQTSLG